MSSSEILRIRDFFTVYLLFFLGDISLVFDLNQSSSVEIFFAYILCSVVQVILFQKHSFTSSLSPKNNLVICQKLYSSIDMRQLQILIN